MKLKIGHRYKNRLGESVIIVAVDKHDNTYQDMNEYWYSENGEFLTANKEENQRDLIAELPIYINFKIDKPDLGDITTLPKIEKTSNGGSKHTEGKIRLDLVPAEMEEALAEGLEAGLRKGYEENNWQKGLSFERYSVAAARRHINKWRKGEDIDTETGVHHLKLAFLNLGMAVTQIVRGREDLDDRFKRGK